MKRGMPPGGVNPVPVKVAVKDKFASPRKEQTEQADVPSFAVAELNSQGTLGWHSSIRAAEAAGPDYHKCHLAGPQCEYGALHWWSGKWGRCKNTCSNGHHRCVTATAV